MARKRTAISAGEKLNVLSAWVKCGDINTVIATFYPGLDSHAHEQRRKLIYQWRKRHGHIEAACKTVKGRRKKKARRRGSGTALPMAAEKELVVWVNDLRGEGVPISTVMLHLQALDVAADYGVPNFRASWSWMKAFKARHKLSMRARTRQGQQSPDNLASIAAAFSKEVAAKVQDLDISKIYNADQTAAFFEYLPTRTIAKKGPKTVWVRCAGKDKDRATVMLLADSNGAKSSPFVVFKTNPSKIPATSEQNTRLRHGFGVRLWKSISEIQKDTSLQIYGNKKGWWNSELSVEFLKFHFATRENMAEPVLLIWDDFSGHWTEEVIAHAAAINVVLMKVPPSATAVSQPADVAWNKPLKEKMRGYWVEDLRTQLRNRVPGKPFKMNAPDRATVARWIDKAWKELSTHTITAGYTRSGLDVPEVQVVASELVGELASLNLIDRSVGQVDDARDFESCGNCDNILNEA